MVNMSPRRRASHKNRLKTVDNHDDFLRRITKSLYYGKLPTISCLSLPVMELSADIFSEAQKGKSLKRLYLEDAAEFSRNACISPCSLVLALVYLDRLKTYNPEYVANMAPAELFLVSLLVSNKFLQDSGEDDEVFPDEWATSAGMTSEALNQIERDFLHAIDWRVFVSEAQFDTSLEWLEHQISMRQAKSRGWFTYTDLANISNTCDNGALMKCLATVYAALSISYLASVYTIVASSLIVSHSLMVLSTSNALLNNLLDNTGSYLYHETTNSSVPAKIVDDNILNYDTTALDNLDSLNYEEERIDNETVYPINSYTPDFAPIYVSFLKEMLQFSFLSNHLSNPKVDLYIDKELSKDLGSWDYYNRNNCKDLHSPLQVMVWTPIISC